MSSTPRPVRQIARTASADRVVEDATAGGPLAAAERPHALALLGQVDELEVEPERADEGLDAGQVEAVELGRQPRPLDRVVCPAQGDRAPSDTLDELEQVETLLLDDDLPEQRAEQLDLARQVVAGTRRPDAARLAADGRVRSGGHRRFLRRSRSAAPTAHLRRV